MGSTHVFGHLARALIAVATVISGKAIVGGARLVVAAVLEARSVRRSRQTANDRSLVERLIGDLDAAGVLRTRI